MSVETILAYALGVIGVLLTMNIALTVYIFKSLKGEVRSVATDVASLRDNRVKLMHRTDCRITTEHLQEQLDEQRGTIQGLSERMARAETKLHVGEPCS